ncbi:Lateral signaling target protein 2 homolog [Geodia barretti]|uniref:Lateral signaling target protein 2 homolog n=1 Tax=Geodia barretti TaxID=519541 RepID=A0AA35TLW7_GEOBA|nr:Lateral signaling target protein 2 homolog [Geodia barretti]
MQELNYLMKTTPDNLDRRATLIRQLKEAQHNLMNVIFAVTRDAVPEHHTCRDFRAKYPDDVLVDQINGPLWFGAECIAAGSHILNHELESEQLRPFAVQLSKTISRVRAALKEQCLTNRQVYSQKLKDMLIEFDVMWADFEFRYVGLMCSVKSERQYYHQQDVIVLFCESTLRALKNEYIDSDMIEMMDPSIMFAIPRLAIVCGLVVCPDGPINPSQPTKELPPFFRGYQTLLGRIKELLGYLTDEQLVILEKALCSSEGLGSLALTPPSSLAPGRASSRPLSNPSHLSPLTPSTTSLAASSSPTTPQSNPVTPNPPRRDIPSSQGSPQVSRPSSHQRSRSLGSNDLADQAHLETAAVGEQTGLDLPASSQLSLTMRRRCC